MPDPINYTAGFTDPSEMVSKSLQYANMFGQIQQNREASMLAQQQAQAKAARDAEIQEAFDIVHANPTAENYANLSNLLPPEMGKSTRETFEMLESSQQQSALTESAQVFSAFKSGNPEIALSLLNAKIDAYKNAGDEEKAKGLQMMIDLAATGPDGIKAVEDMFGFNLAQMPGGKEAIEGALKYADEVQAVKMRPELIKKQLLDNGFTEAQTNKVIAETRKLGLEADKMVSDIEAAKNALPPGRELSPNAEKLVNDSVIAAAKAKTLTTQYSTLAADFDTAVRTSGIGAKTSEIVTKIFGTEKEPTALRQEYLRMRNTAVLEMLPPGVASDKDIELALAAFPTETSSPANIAGFLRGMSKLQAYEAALNGAKAEWIQQNGNLGTASTEMQVGNRNVKQGGRFTEFIETYIPNTSVLGTVTGQTGSAWGSTPPGEAQAVDIAGLREFVKKNNPNATGVDTLTAEEIKARFPNGYNTFTASQPAQSAQPAAAVEVDY